MTEVIELLKFNTISAVKVTEVRISAVTVYFNYHILTVSMFNIPVNNFSVMSGQSNPFTCMHYHLYGGLMCNDPNVG